MLIGVNHFQSVKNFNIGLIHLACRDFANFSLVGSNLFGGMQLIILSYLAITRYLLIVWQYSCHTEWLFIVIHNFSLFISHLNESLFMFFCLLLFVLIGAYLQLKDKTICTALGYGVPKDTDDLLWVVFFYIQLLGGIIMLAVIPFCYFSIANHINSAMKFIDSDLIRRQTRYNQFLGGKIFKSHQKNCSKLTPFLSWIKIYFN